MCIRPNINPGSFLSGTGCSVACHGAAGSLLCALTLLSLAPAACRAAPDKTLPAPDPVLPAPVLHRPVQAAVFSQPGFPFYMLSSLTSPRTIAADLRAAGIPTDELDADALADPQRFDARRYAILALPYGNTYPAGAFANLRAFHRAGGDLVLSGIPFTHAAARLSASGWDPSPGWGDEVRTTADAHQGRRALALTHSDGDWVGAASKKFPVRPGESVSVEGWVKDAAGADGGDDWIFARFFGPGGHFISQKGPAITPGAAWHPVSLTVTVPPGAAVMDLAPQVRSSGRSVLLDDLQVTLAGGKRPVLNGGFETPGDVWVDEGHSSDPALFGPEGIGVGGFAGPPSQPGSVELGPGDPLDLAPIHPDWKASASLQWLAADTLPPGDRVIPALTVGGKPTAALILHRDRFRGAVDVWTQHPGSPDRDAYLTEQLLARGVIAALAEQGLLGPTRRRSAMLALNRAPRPRSYVGLVLPAPPRPYPTFQPKMHPPAAHLYTADVRGLTRDQRLLLLSLQGLVNRKQPRIYLIFGDSDRFWLQEMQRQGSTGSPIPMPDPLSLVKRFRSEIKGAIISDPHVYLSPDIAASQAGADDLVMATPALAARLGLPVKVDLRGKFADDAAALRSLRTRLFPRLNPYLSICLDPAILDTGAIDQIIAARGSVFWVTGPKAQGLPGANMSAELEELKALLAEMPLEAVVRGFWWHGDGQGLDEGAGVSLGSRFGKVTVVSDYVANFSVFSGVPASSLKQKPRPAPPPLDRSKVYLAITVSDGDNLTTWRDYFRSYFNDPLHGSFPIGWGMGPTLIDCAPTWARWYYDHATPNDEFLCDVSGVGYMYPPDWATALRDREGAFRSFYSWTERYMARMDMRTIRLMGVGRDDIARAGRDLPQVSFLMPDYGFAGERSYSAITYSLPTRQPAFRAITTGSGAENLTDQIRSRVGADRPAFVNVFIWNWGSRLSDLKKMLDDLGPNYVAVTPSQLNALYREAMH